MASDRSKRGGGKETPLPTPYQVTVTYANPNGGVIQNNGADWFGPLNPMNPSAPPEVSGRRFDFPSGYNLAQQPKAYEPVGFQTLRSLADGYDLVRIIIETRKDQLSTMNWNIVPRDPRVRAEGEMKERIKQVESFFLRPDKVHFWDEWLRMVLEDLLVIDAPSLYKRRTKGGELYALEPIDGATIKRVIDDWGRTPEAPVPAYQQVLKGMPAVDYDTTQLLYRPRNVRTNKIYGYSPVEQILMTINIALRRQVFQLQYFTEGNIPEALIGVPETWTPDQIKQFQDWFDGILQGNTAERRRARFVPNAVGKTYIPTKNDELFGKAEEWLARVVCFAFSINAQPFVAMMNRATAEQAGADADATGTAPLKKYIKGLVDTVILDDFGFEDLQFQWVDADEEDNEKKQKRLSGYVADGLLSINEARIKMGEDPDPDPIFNELMMKTSMGYLVIKNGPMKTNAAESKTPSDDTPAEDQTAPQPEGDPDPANKLAKAVDAAKPYADLERKTAVSAVKRTARKVKRELSALGASVEDQLKNTLVVEDAEKIVRKAAPEDLDEIIKALELDGLWSLFAFFEEELADMFEDAAETMIAYMGVEVGVPNERAAKWAEERAATLIGKSPTGGLLDETTRNMIRTTISTGLEAGKSAEEIAKDVRESHAFSEDRAELIAMTEIARANSEGALESYKAAKDAGVNIQKSWFNLEDACDICSVNGAQGPIDLEKAFTSGDQSPPGHPDCRCALVPIIQGEDQ